MRRAFLSVAALVAVALAHAAPLTGKYRLRNASGSTDGLTLRVNGRFLLEDGRRVVHGDYRVDDDRLVLNTEDGDRLRAEIHGATIVLDGQEFERVSPLQDDTRRFPTDGATGRLDRIRRDDRSDRRERDRSRDERREPELDRRAPVELPAPVPDAPPAPVAVVITPAPRPAAVAPALPALLVEDCCGAWTVRQDGHEEKGWRMELNRDGTFRFGMKGLSSEGTWTVEGREIVLTYLKVDGAPLEDGASGVKRIPVARNASAFQIDTYRYERATP